MDQYNYISSRGSFVCAPWRSPLSHWKTFLPFAFGLCGRRERLLSHGQSGVHSCHTHVNTSSTDNYSHRLKPGADYSGSLTQLQKASHTDAHTQRGSQRAACQEDEHGRECRKPARTALELCHSQSVNVGAKEQSRKQVWTNLLNLAYCYVWLWARKLLVRSHFRSRIHTFCRFKLRWATFICPQEEISWRFAVWAEQVAVVDHLWFLSSLL